MLVVNRAIDRIGESVRRELDRRLEHRKEMQRNLTKR
jgi:hypothetical protein